MDASSLDVDIERACLNLFKCHAHKQGAAKVQEAIPDVVAVVHGSCQQCELDVTVHSPLAVSLQNAHCRPSTAAINDERHKLTR